MNYERVLRTWNFNKKTQTLILKAEGIVSHLPRPLQGTNMFYMIMLGGPQ